MISPAPSPPTRVCLEVLLPPMKRQWILMVGIPSLKIFIYMYNFIDILFLAEPPSYQSLFRQFSSQLSDTDYQSRSIGRILCSLLCVLLSSCVGILILLSAILTIIIVLGIPVSMIVMGSIHLQDCPAQRFIPIFLILSGILTFKVYDCLFQYKSIS